MKRLTVREIDLLDLARCPDCGRLALTEGPCAGLSMNVYCDNCGAGFNIIPGLKGFFGKERIVESQRAIEPVVVVWDELPLKPIEPVAVVKDKCVLPRFLRWPISIVTTILKRQPFKSWPVRLVFAWYDLWIGAYWDRKQHRLFILPFPCIGIVIQFKHE